MTDLKTAICVWLACLIRLFAMPVKWCFQTPEQRHQTYIGEDQSWNTVLNGWADETISAWAHRNHHKRTERLINWLFRDPLHCAKAYLSEMEGSQNAPEYQNGKGV